MGNGISSIDDEAKINVGRPFGGVGIMWRKHLNTCCTFRTYDCDSIVGMEINGSSISVLVLCAYHLTVLTIMMIICFISLKFYRLLKNLALHISMYVATSMQICCSHLGLVKN